MCVREGGEGDELGGKNELTALKALLVSCVTNQPELVYVNDVLQRFSKRN